MSDSNDPLASRQPDPVSHSTESDRFGRLPESLRQLVRDRGIYRTFEAGDLMMEPGDSGERIRFIVSGKANLQLRHGSGQHVTVNTLGRGDMFGEMSFFTDRPAPPDMELRAEEHCDVMELTAEDFDRYVQQNPAFVKVIVKNLARTILRLDRNLLKSRLSRQALQSVVSREDYVFPDFVAGEYFKGRLSKRMKELAELDGPILISGETGVGKEVVAHSLFKMSMSYKEVFLLTDVSRSAASTDAPQPEESDGDTQPALTASQITLFIGGETSKEDNTASGETGLLDLADGGTLLLRRTELLTARAQHVIADYLFADGKEATGSTGPVPGLRLICSTELTEVEITADRHPLLHRMIDRSLYVPPLRKRRREIPSLVTGYLEHHAAALRKPVPEVPNETMKTLVSYNWPGNDLELSATLKRALLVSDDGIVRPSHIYFDITRFEGEGKLNLLRFNPVRRAVLSPLFPAILQSAAAPFFFILLFLLFLGPPAADENIGSLFSWALGWPSLVIGALLWARFWCTLCPMGTLSKLAKKVVALEISFPAVLKRHSEALVAGAVLFIIWLESALHMRASPLSLGLLLLVITALALVFAVIFERQSWCRYLCPLGGMTGVMAMASTVELRADRNVCGSRCESQDCYYGTLSSEGCPFGHVAPTLTNNLTCKMCGTCAKNCPHGAVEVNLRVPGQELWEMRHINSVTAFLVLAMMGALLSEMISYGPVGAYLTAYLQVHPTVDFTLIFVTAVLATSLLTIAAATISHRLSGRPLSESYAVFGLAQLPLVLMTFIAFHVYYLINLGVQIPILVSRNFDFELLKSLIITVPPDVTQTVQETLIVLGLIWTVYVMYRIGAAITESRKNRLGIILPHVITAAVLAYVADVIMHGFFYGG